MAAALLDLFVGDQVYVDRSGLGGRGDPDAGGEDLRDAAAPAGAQDELGGVDAAGEVEQRLGDVVADHLVVRAAEAFDQLPLPGQVGRVRLGGQPVGPGDVHGEQVGSLGTG